MTFCAPGGVHLGLVSFILIMCNIAALELSQSSHHSLSGSYFEDLIRSSLCLSVGPFIDVGAVRETPNLLLFGL